MEFSIGSVFGVLIFLLGYWVGRKSYQEPTSESLPAPLVRALTPKAYTKGKKKPLVRDDEAAWAAEKKRQSTMLE